MYFGCFFKGAELLWGHEPTYMTPERRYGAATQNLSLPIGQRSNASEVCKIQNITRLNLQLEKCRLTGRIPDVKIAYLYAKSVCRILNVLHCSPTVIGDGINVKSKHQL